MKKIPNPNLKIQRNPRGFTMIELLIVITIIVVLMTAGAMGVRNLTAGKGSATAISNAEAIFSEARTTAIGRATNVRVLIDVNTPSDRDNYLRKMLVAYQNVDATTNLPTDQWLLASRGYTLPENTYFSKVYSVKGGGSTLAVDQATMKFSNIGNSSVANNRRYAYYEFNNQGICITPGAKFIIGTGVRQGAQDPRMQGTTKDFAGFSIWNNGETSTLRSPDQMGIQTGNNVF